MLASFLLCMAWALMPLAGAAQSRKASASEPAGYRSAIGSGIEEFELNHFTEAREHFARAHALYPNARTLRGLGLCDFELRRYVDAVRFLEAALASEVKRLDGKLRKDTETILMRAQGYVGKLRVITATEGALVTIDGMTVEPGADGDLMLEVGDHVLEVRATGHLTERRELQVRGGQDQRVEIKLTEVELAPETVAANTHSPATQREPAQPASKRTPVYKTWWLWTLVGVAVAGAAAGTAVAATRDPGTTYEPTPGANTPAGVSLQPLGAR